ncbi:cytochrome P450 [Amylocystis lapponica]|nr:cytochrome P450 [Amylocystis lapponica]
MLVKEQHIFEHTDMFIRSSAKCSTLANMRDLLPIIQPIADKLQGIFLSQLPPDGPDGGVTELNLVPWMSRAALEYISQAGFGYSFNALDPSNTNEYADAVRLLSPSAVRILILRPFIPLIVRTCSLQWRNRLVDWMPIAPLKNIRRIVQIMDKTSRKIFAEKKATLERRGGIDAPRTEGDLGERMKGKDIMSIMLRANSSSSETDRLTDAELLGQMNTIMFAGFETTTIAICRVIFILAERAEVQARLRSEIRAAKLRIASASDAQRWEDVPLSYDELMSLPYLDAIVRETLRVYPPTSLPSRTATRATTHPLQYPIRSTSGVPLHVIAIPEGTNIIMSILAANHNTEVWGPDAHEWRPERWLTSDGRQLGMSRDADAEGMPGQKDGVKYPGVYATMMTFLGGGRACIGFKFAEMEMKQVLTTLLSTVHFALPSAVDAQGQRKEIYWKMNALQVPVVRAPAGDDHTPQVPLDVRRVQEGDFL